MDSKINSQIVEISEDFDVTFNAFLEGVYALLRKDGISDTAITLAILQSLTNIIVSMAMQCITKDEFIAILSES